MEFRHYQEEAQKTDRVPLKAGEDDDHSVIVPLLGLAGEAGGLLSEYKKYLRDGSGHKLFEKRVKEELGDILWYVANLATKFGLDLNTVVQDNILKIRDRWEVPCGDSAELFHNSYMFDAGFPQSERFPRQIDVELRVIKKDGRELIQLLVNGKQCGDVGQRLR
jgi:NTP pyrophosphatase (non-canonical NTP hydrolase)